MLSRRGIVELYQTWHGAAGGRTGVRFGAYAADTCSPELLRAISTAAETRGAGIHTHAAQSRLEDDYLWERHG